MESCTNKIFLLTTALQQVQMSLEYIALKRLFRLRNPDEHVFVRLRKMLSLRVHQNYTVTNQRPSDRRALIQAL